MLPDDVRDLVRERKAARAASDFERADALRDELRALGWEVQDRPSGSSVRPVLPEAPVETGYARPEDLASVLDQPAAVAASLQVVVEDHPDDLRRFVNGLATHPPGVSWELVVVANAPAFGVEGVLAESALGIEPAVLSTNARLGWADAVNLGLRRSFGEATILMDASVEPVGEFVAPLAAALEQPGVGLAGPWGVVSGNGRQFEEASAGEVDAIEVYCLGIRRDALRDVSGFDHRYRFYRHADLDFSFAVRDVGWRALAVAGLPLERHEHRAWASLPEAERNRLSKRNFYRFLKRWGDRRDLLLHPQQHDH